MSNGYTCALVGYVSLVFFYVYIRHSVRYTLNSRAFPTGAIKRNSQTLQFTNAECAAAIFIKFIRTFVVVDDDDDHDTERGPETT